MYEHKNNLPKIGKRQLLQAYRQIKPVSTIGNNEYREIVGWNDFDGEHFFEKEPDHLRDIVFTHKPILANKPLHLNELGVFPICFEIRAYLTGKFKPTIAEVLAQIPRKHNGGKVAAFDVSREYEITPDEKYHASTAMLFKKRYALAD